MLTSNLHRQGNWEVRIHVIVVGVMGTIYKGGGDTRGYKDGLQPETLADCNWLVKQNQPASNIETKSDTN